MALTRITALQVLGLPSAATEDDVKGAYRKLASKFHPDKNPGDAASAARMSRINEAYNWLTDPKNAKKAWSKNDFSGFDWAKNSKTKFSYSSMIPTTLSEAFHGHHKIVNFAALGQNNFTIPIPRGVMPGSRLKIITSTEENGNEIEVDVRVDIDPGEWTVRWAVEPNLYGGGVEGSGDMEKTIHVDMFTMMRGGSVNFDTIDGATLQLRIIEGMEAGTRLKVKGRGYWKDSNCSARGDVFLRVMPKIRKLDDIPQEELEKFATEFKNALVKKRDPFGEIGKQTSTFA